MVGWELLGSQFCNRDFIFQETALSVISYQLSVIRCEFSVHWLLFTDYWTWYGSLGGHKSTKSLSGKKLNWWVRSSSKTIDKNRQMSFSI